MKTEGDREKSLGVPAGAGPLVAGQAPPTAWTPDLLAALKELLEAERLLTDYENSDLTTDEQEQFDSTQIYERMEAAREGASAAIAKAEQP